MACKNLEDVFEDVQLINKTSTNIQVKGILCLATKSQDSMKATKRYIQGQVTDGN